MFSMHNFTENRLIYDLLKQKIIFVHQEEASYKLLEEDTNDYLIHSVLTYIYT